MLVSLKDIFHFSLKSLDIWRTGQVIEKLKTLLIEIQVR